MLSLSAPVLAALAAGEVALATLVRIDFPSGVVALNASQYELVWGGVTYKAAAGLGDVTPINDGPSEIAGASLQLLRVDAIYMGLALDSTDEVQGSPTALMTAIFDRATHQVLHVELDWQGKADTMTISEDGEHGVITLTAEGKAVDLLRGNSLLYNDADQQSLVPGDRYFEYVESQSDKKVVWPSRELLMR